MKRFKSILFVNGKPDDKAAFERAATLAVRNQAALTVVEVLETLPRDERMLINAKHNVDLMEIAAQKSSKHLESLIAPLESEGLRVDSKVLLGTPFLEIVREVLRKEHDLVIKAAEGKSQTNHMLFGSTAMHLMRKCPCPVWVIKPNRRERHARILAAVDPAPSDSERQGLNTKIMELATSLAELEGSELHIVHCWRQPYEGRLKMFEKMFDELARDTVDKIISDTRNEHKMWLTAFLEEFELEHLNHRLHLLKGEPGLVIPRLAWEKRIELIVMGTVCRTGIAGFFIGNTAEKVLSQVDCSVLTVKPDGFVTPVRLDE
jgi:nucleotide-binding universal stress UspA family protein